MKNLIMCLMLVLIAACGGGGGSGGGGFAPITHIPMPPDPVPEIQEPTPKCHISLWGDSVLYGGHSLNQRLETPVGANMALQRPSWVIQDNSMNGGSATLQLSYFLQHPLSDIVVLQYGINDVGNNLPYESSMRSMIERAKSLNKTVILTGFSQGDIANRNQGNQTVEKLALEHGLLFADWSTVEYTKEDTFDGIHPRQEYSNRLAARLIETIKLTGCM